MMSRRVSPMKLWASNNGEEVAKKAGVNASDIGSRSKAAATLWRELSEEERAEWERLADEHSKDKPDQCYL